ncbi:hypothetical protein BSKO_13385 [Bryopsis sp. KO-2023]|nr:hypothetical protein BSKO_13385 [Bryopsis sp. KO-2023]
MSRGSKHRQGHDFLNLPCWPLILRNFGRVDFVSAASTCKKIFDASKFHESWGPTVRLHKLAKRAKHSLLEVALRDDTAGDSLILEKFERLQWCFGQFLFFTKLSFRLSSLSRPFVEKVTSSIRLRELKEEIKCIGGGNHHVKTMRFCFLLQNGSTIEVLYKVNKPCDLFTRLQTHAFKFCMEGANDVILPWRKESYGAVEVNNTGIADKEWDLKPYVHALEETWEVSHMSVSFFISIALLAVDHALGNHTCEEEEPPSLSSTVPPPSPETRTANQHDVDLAARCLLNCPVSDQGEGPSEEQDGGNLEEGRKGFTLLDLDAEERELAAEMRLLANEVVFSIKLDGVGGNMVVSRHHIEMFFQLTVEHAIDMLKSMKIALVNFKFHGEIMMRWSAPRDAFVRLLEIATVQFHRSTVSNFEISRSILFLVPGGGAIKATSDFFMDDPSRGLGCLRSLVVASQNNDTHSHITSDGYGIGSRLEEWRLQLKPTVRLLARLSGNRGLCDVCVMSFFLWILVGDFQAIDKLVGALCDVARGGNGDSRYC